MTVISKVRPETQRGKRWPKTGRSVADVITTSASFVPSLLVGYRKVYSVRCEADVTMEKHVLHETTEGTPQGGIISAALANRALDGLERVLRER
jgi:hypothetical protein